MAFFVSKYIVCSVYVDELVSMNSMKLCPIHTLSDYLNGSTVLYKYHSLLFI